ncbi:YycH family regulatory protein [Peribacillus asahii]|uniref:YycH family regulatory protein n=1 Tax=Peribacillus asahii TaxID=228899 RepID=UPI00207A1D25|nr:two-component system activity regulator YycH [Peribacillus asahii]USK70303.1 two-component system activity regulator YycH [Peribacillus asahii]
MNLERAKSIVLFLLIAISTYLTWSIWTYKPELEKIDQGPFLVIDREEKTAGDVIKPSNILIHRNQQHYQTSSPVDLEKASAQMNKWNLYNAKKLSTHMTKKEMNDFMHEDGTVEIIFPDDVPFQLYKNVVGMVNREVPTFSFDRILYKQKDIQSKESVLYFVSSQELSILEASIQTKRLSAFHTTFFQKANTYPEYVPHAVNNQHEVFVSKDEISLPRYKYLIDYLNIKNFKNALFADPVNVRHETVVSGDEYTDSTRLLSVDKTTHMLSYINTSQKSKMLSSSSDLLKKSIEFVNNHAGWKESNYRFAYMDEQNQRVIFRLYHDGYPVFNHLGMSEIEEIWGKDEMYSYQRPYFTFQTADPFEQSFVSLPSGQEVLKQLKTMRNFDYFNLEDITIGYKLSMAPLDDNLMFLEPTWYYRSGGDWLAVPFDEAGGEMNGLE